MKITLHRTEKCWVARFHDAPEIKELMGTDVIPTTFTTRANSDVVLAAIQRLNPEDHVTISSSCL